MTQVAAEPVAVVATPAPGGGEGRVPGGAERVLATSSGPVTVVSAPTAPLEPTNVQG